MLTSVEAAEVISRAKGSSELSVRALAAAAGVAGSTITRIQRGTVDPSIETFEHILGAAGYELRLSIVRRGAKRVAALADLSDAWSARGGRTRIEWTRWRALLDHLAMHPERVAEAIYIPPLPSGSRVVDALLAGVADKLADDAGLARPSWAEVVPALEEPFQPLSRTGVQHEVPPQLVERGVMIDVESLWRDRRTVGV
jgi:transcriptional regulator with XRE-family HTH domain